MSYFQNAKVNDKVCGAVFGSGKIINILEDSYYKLEVKFKNGHQVHYTEEGIPNWGNFDEQTLFYKEDMDLNELDSSGVSDPLGLKKIMKLRAKGEKKGKEYLEMKGPNGKWHDLSKMDNDYIQEALENKLMFLFREK